MSASGESKKECSKYGGAYPHQGDCLTSSEDHYLTLFFQQGFFLCAISHRQGITHQGPDDTVRAQGDRTGQQGIKTQQSFLLLLNP